MQLDNLKDGFPKFVLKQEDLVIQGIDFGKIISTDMINGIHFIHQMLKNFMI